MAEAKIVVLIETEIERGYDVCGNPPRLVKRYSTAKGEFVAEYDPFDPLGKIRDTVSACAAGHFDTHQAFARILDIVRGIRD